MRERMAAASASRDLPMIDVVSVRPLDGYRLRLRLSNGHAGVHDFSDMIADGGPMVEPLRDTDLFRRVFVECGVLTWPNGFDVDSINLHMQMLAAGELTPAAAE